MKTSELRQKYLDFFASKSHAILPSASLIPENDPTCLFTTAGMHPLVPYLLGEKHPSGARLANCQKCVRTGDIEEVGDAIHLTFFEMLGNWSLGDYWKEEALSWSFEFLTKELGFPIEKLAVSVFEGEEGGAPYDAEAYEIWKKLGISEKRIAKLSRKNNWWGPAGQTGPCGPDSEMFYWTGETPAPEDFQATCEDPLWVEVWNDVFMQYNKDEAGKYIPLAQTNVDTGMGLDRVAAILQGKSNVFETDAFAPIIAKIRELATVSEIRSERIIADHLRAATFIIGDSKGITPSNVDAGYVVRRLIRRAIREARKLGFDFRETFTTQIAEVIISIFGEHYPELVQNSGKVLLALEKEENQFKKTLENGLKYLKENVDAYQELFGDIAEDKIPFKGGFAFYMYETFGFPPELTLEELKNDNRVSGKLNEKEFWDHFNKRLGEHQDASRTAAAGRFAGGLADNSAETTALHTAAHILLAALRKVLGNHVEQRGSNITAERLRFDFSHPDKLTDAQKAEVEKIVNDAIQAKLPVVMEEMDLEKAREAGAMGIFESKYGEKVKVYTIGDPANPISREICGGPHVSNTSELGKFQLKKEESSSSGVRRIKAILIKE
ncbi:MAG: alanine--tRNA ligase [Candidatus Gracilibacteria bacterium]|jgi:alanyl-tRNA synthetase|nr:alanine--tRNA ligase [Candidatus Gracilibacteria bacterium]MDD5179112.1 alanine--tRNA ligase [Candidatus Gracilibacteria bacterium]